MERMWHIHTYMHAYNVKRITVQCYFTSNYKSVQLLLSLKQIRTNTSDPRLIHTVLLTDNVTNACNFIASYECVSSYQVCFNQARAGRRPVLT